MVRTLLDEVFGAANFLSLISFQKTGGSSGGLLETINDYILWYARDGSGVVKRYNQLYLHKALGDLSDEITPWFKETPDGSYSAMKILHDHEGLAIRLTDERLEHILEHPEMKEMAKAIEETLLRPERVVESFSDPRARLYYRFYFGTLVGDKYVCVIVKVSSDDAFVLTASLTDRIKKGVTIWPKEK